MKKKSKKNQKQVLKRRMHIFIVLSAIFAISTYIYLNKKAEPKVLGESKEKLFGDTPRDRWIQEAIKAIEANDAEAYMALMVSVEDMKKYCPDIFDIEALAQKKREENPTREELAAKIKKWEDTMRRNVSKRPQKVRKALQRCHDLIDFQKAKPMEILGGEKKRYQTFEELCPNAVTLKDIKVIYKDGTHRYQVRLKAPVVFDEKLYRGMHKPRCDEKKNP